MATKLPSDHTQAKASPSYKNANFPPATALVNGNPSWLACFAYWLDKIATTKIDVAEYFKLQYRPLTDDWFGSSAKKGLHLTVQVIKRLPSTRYAIVVTLWRDDVMLNDEWWHDVDAGHLPAFDSKLIRHLHKEGRDKNGLHILA